MDIGLSAVASTSRLELTKNDLRISSAYIPGEVSAFPLIACQIEAIAADLFER